MIIETERLILRSIEIADLDEFAAINADTETMRYFPATLTREQSASAIARYQKAERENGFSFCAAELEKTGELAGVIGISKFDDVTKAAIPGNPSVEIGWRLCSDFWRQGLATEGAKAFLDYGFEELGLEEIVAITAVQNVPSRGVMTKLGMHHVPSGNFVHPSAPAESSVAEHVLYRLANPKFAAH